MKDQSQNKKNISNCHLLKFYYYALRKKKKKKKKAKACPKSFMNLEHQSWPLFDVITVFSWRIRIFFIYVRKKVSCHNSR